MPGPWVQRQMRTHGAFIHLMGLHIHHIGWRCATTWPARGTERASGPNSVGGRCTAWPSRSTRWNVPDRLVQLTATHEAQMGGVVQGERVLVVADGVGGPADRIRAGYVALVRAVGTQHAPVRVTLAAPSRGELTQVAVDADLLDLAVDRVTEHVAHRADPDRSPVVPGRWCVHCHLLQDCAEGLARVGAASVPPEGR